MSNIKYTWEEYYPLACSYYAKNKNLLVNCKYVTDTGFELGKWILNLRKSYKKGTLSEEKIILLEEIGMVWDVYEEEWWKQYKLLKEFYENYGTIYPLEKLPTINGYNLAIWVKNQISKHNNLNLPKGKALTQDRIDALEKLNIEWNRYENVWEKFFLLAKDYYIEHENLMIPADYVSSDGSSLGSWISHQRAQYITKKLTKSRIELLEEIGMIWNPYINYWDKNYQIVKDIYEKKGTIYPLAQLPVVDGIKLSTWVNTQIYNYNCAKRHDLSDEQITLLENIGIRWNKKYDDWDNMFKIVKVAYEKNCNNGLLLFPNENEFVKIKRWIRKQRVDYEKRTNPYCQTAH